MQRKFVQQRMGAKPVREYYFDRKVFRKLRDCSKVEQSKNALVSLFSKFETGLGPIERNYLEQ